ncbi:hypothetical protein BGZ60DRAFT_534617 [Tricladium varicosporioides]|nr:hypothetical protein BGZ60DRAFT_534617 [Hymenoscyphus varicosporioides]
MRTYATFTTTKQIIRFIRNELLLASLLAYGSLRVSSPLPDAQWHIEMENLQNISMAGLQANALYHASPGAVPTNPDLNLLDFIVEDSSPSKRKLCSNQKFRSIGYSSFSILGISLIFLLSLTIILLNLGLPAFLGWIQEKVGRTKVGPKRWIEDDILQVQRMAFEGRNVGPWVGQRGGVPVTEEYGMKICWENGGENILLSKDPQ